MATIQIILQAINNASRTFDEVTAALEQVAAAEEQTTDTARTLAIAEMEAAGAAQDLRDAFGELAAAESAATAANEGWAASAEEVTAAAQEARGAADAAAGAYAKLTAGQLAAADAALAAAGDSRAQAESFRDVTRSAMGAANRIERLAETEVIAAADAAALAAALRAQDEAADAAARSASLNAIAQDAAAAASADGASAAGQAAAAAAAAAAANEEDAAAVGRAAKAAALAAGASATNAAAIGRAAKAAVDDANANNADALSMGRAAGAAAASAAAYNARAAAAARAARAAAAAPAIQAAADAKAAAAAARSQAAADRAAAAQAALAAATGRASGKTDEAGKAAGNAARMFLTWGGAVGALNKPVQLWGGLLDGILPKMFTQIKVWHLLADAVIEIAAVWGPAIAGVSAWGVAASDAIQDVERHMENLHTVADATGQAISPMTGELEKLHDAVRPQVYQLFGDYLSVMAARGGEFNKVIMGTGQVLDQLGARMALAVKGAGFSEFMSKAVTDVRLLGTAFGNLFGIIGNLIRMNQGWATVLLQVGTAFLGLLEHVTAVLIPLGQLLVFGHGFVLWVGLAVTGVIKFGSAIAGWATGIYNAAAGFVSLIRMVIQYTQAVGVMDALAEVNPFVWVGIAVAALAGLAFIIATTKDATQRWGDTMQKTLTDAQSLSAGTRQMTADLSQVNGQISQFASQHNVQALNNMTQASRGGGQAAAELKQHYQDLTGVQKTLVKDQDTYNTRLQDLARQYGGVSNAQGLLIASGVTMKQMLDGSGAAWAMIQQQVEGTYRGYGAMAEQTGILGNAMQVMDKQATDQYQAMQKLNQAWDQQTADMTAAQGAFDTAAQGFDTLANANQKVTLTLGKLKEKFDLAKAGIDSLTPSGIALNQAFQAQVGNINSLADSWRSAGVSQDQFKAGIKDSIALLVPYARGSQEATAELAGLAQEAGYDGPAAMKNLVEWLGNTSGGLQQIKNISNQATVQEALLTQAMQAQGAYIANQLIGDINQAILKYDGVRDAAAQYGRAVAQSGRDSDAAHAARQRLIDDIVKAGTAAGDTKGEIAALITKVLGIPKKAALQIVMQGTGTYTIHGALINSATGQAQQQASGIHITTPASRGLLVRGGPANKDSQLILAQHGELVVPAHMVNAGAVAHLRGKIPGYAAGGVVGGGGNPQLTGNTDVLTGQYAVTMHQKFQDVMVAAMVSAMRAAIKQAAAAAASAGGGYGSNAGPAGGDAAANAQIARQMFPQWASGALWDAWNYVAMRESGWNRFARNPSSGAYGIPQALPPTKLPPAGQASGGSHAGPQIGWMAGYMSGRYGGPAGAAAHEKAYNWYDSGGLLPTGPSLSMNQTGQPELVLPPAVIDNFTGSLQQLHAPLVVLISAVHAQTDALGKLTDAAAAQTQATQAAATAAAKPKPPAKPTPVQLDQRKVAEDKANASRLEARIGAVQQAIKDTPAKDKAARKEEEQLLKQLQAALKSQDKKTGADQKALAKEIVKENKAVVAAMEKQIAAITKLLGSGSAATSKSSGLWTQLVADEKKLAAAQAVLAGQVSGKSGGSGMKVTGTVTVDKGQIAALQAAEVKAYNAAVAKLQAEIAKGGPHSKLAADDLQTLVKRQAAELGQYAKTMADSTNKNFSHLMALLHDLVHTANDKGLNELPGTAPLVAALRSAATAEANLAKSLAGRGGTSSGGGGGTSVSGSGGYVSGVVTDRKAESELSQLLAEARKENAELVKIAGLLGQIKNEAEPSAQAKAIGPAVAQAINSTSRNSANAKTTRRG